MLDKLALLRRAAPLIGLIVVAAAVGVSSAGAAVLGTSLPASISATLTQGGPPNFADTFVTPYVSQEGGTVTSWKAQFLGGMFPAIPPDQGGPFEAGPSVPAGIQLKVLRPVSATTLQVVAAGQVHDPRPVLQARFGGSYPFFLTADSVIEFTDPGLELLPGDVIGLTIKSNPLIGRYAYPLVGAGATRLVLRDVPVGGTIDLNDPFTGSLPSPPAVQVNVVSTVTAVNIDVKPGTSPNSINIGSNGSVAVAIFSTPSFDARTVDPLSVTLAGASVEVKGKGTPMASFADVDGDGLLDLVVHVSTEALELTDGDTEVVLEGKTFGGVSIQGTDLVRVIS
jgi:hypothetical protein